jgi:putative ABC transport system substrate-binding protein
MAARPPAMRAQQLAKVPRIGWIWNGRSAGNPIEAAGFRQGLKEFGYIEGQNIVVDYRVGENSNDRIADLFAARAVSSRSARASESLGSGGVAQAVGQRILGL